MGHKVEIYTDGSSLGNPGPGGWGVLMLQKNERHEMGAHVEQSTNNQMELLAMEKALEFIASRGVVDWEIHIYSDSKYVLSGITEWMYGWEKRGWRKADKKEVLNKEYWLRLMELKTYLETENKLFFNHVKAHAGHEHNERVDDIARLFAEKKDPGLVTSA